MFICYKSRWTPSSSQTHKSSQICPSRLVLLGNCDRLDHFALERAVCSMRTKAASKTTPHGHEKLQREKIGSQRLRLLPFIARTCGSLVRPKRCLERHLIVRFLVVGDRFKIVRQKAQGVVRLGTINTPVYKGPREEVVEHHEIQGMLIYAKLEILQVDLSFINTDSHQRATLWRKGIFRRDAFEATGAVYRLLLGPARKNDARLSLVGIDGFYHEEVIASDGGAPEDRSKECEGFLQRREVPVMSCGRRVIECLAA
eukprot:scaffold393_cov279-Pinguiococcus_pyrenoidosus.AAC.2